MSEQRYDYDSEHGRAKQAAQPNQSGEHGETQGPVAISPEDLSAATLESLVESFALREGTDYGAEEVSIETKTSQVLRQLKEGLVQIVFDPNSESVTILTEREWKQLASRHTQD